MSPRAPFPQRTNYTLSARRIRQGAAGPSQQARDAAPKASHLPRLPRARTYGAVVALPNCISSGGDLP
jgi:hypothetical protein